MLASSQADRFARQILVPEIGARGQERLLAAEVEVRAEGEAADALGAYLSAAGVHSFGPKAHGSRAPAGSKGHPRVVSPAEAVSTDRWILAPSAVAWSCDLPPCGRCLAEVIPAEPAPAPFAHAVAWAAGAALAAQLLLLLAGEHDPAPGAWRFWPEATLLPLPARCRHG